MDEDEPVCLKRFGFLPEEKNKKKRRKTKNRHVGRKKSERHYVKESRGVYLTTREAEASWLVANGRTVREIAIEMILSPRTVEFYLKNVRQKLGVRNKHELLRVLEDNDFFRRFR